MNIYGRPFCTLFLTLLDTTNGALYRASLVPETFLSKLELWKYTSTLDNFSHRLSMRFTINIACKTKYETHCERLDRTLTISRWYPSTFSHLGPQHLVSVVSCCRTSIALHCIALVTVNVSTALSDLRKSTRFQCSENISRVAKHV